MQIRRISSSVGLRWLPYVLRAYHAYGVPTNYVPVPKNPSWVVHVDTNARREWLEATTTRLWPPILHRNYAP